MAAAAAAQVTTLLRDAALAVRRNEVLNSAGSEAVSGTDASNDDLFDVLAADVADNWETSDIV